MLFPRKINVEFAQVVDPQTVRMRVWERGAGETMACGTGAVASALIAALLKGVESPVEVITTGGDALTILFDLHDGPIAENVFLQGPTRLICTGDLTAEALL